MSNEQEKLDAFILRAGFYPRWDNLEYWARTMAKRAVLELDDLLAQLDTETNQHLKEESVYAGIVLGLKNERSRIDKELRCAKWDITIASDQAKSWQEVYGHICCGKPTTYKPNTGIGEVTGTYDAAVRRAEQAEALLREWIAGDEHSERDFAAKVRAHFSEVSDAPPQEKP